MAATAASAAMARQNGFCYLYDSELGAVRCLPSKKACEQSQANDPMALSECIKFTRSLGEVDDKGVGDPSGRPGPHAFLMEI
jgi:hypothetical protein